MSPVQINPECDIDFYVDRYRRGIIKLKKGDVKNGTGHSRKKRRSINNT